ncbi:hypothetical protein A3C23_01880 [Candidatus Roizmanbacteria bacterium RIFCSPHIGHO2_02_FULL_37_13b]|uniref:Uncharacterized protein n=1 Tax=Candidatus Roizmanbacteria bacterium RIFCSPLOWO2_02_FULL_36_11 TaxID=1802071 RepID=A0A1F7JBL8_9BACT|nr:MAG: hypothetical protein A3C23_01880 [Candidatus Roizmanbacteria bacterium RIFCSPHIGHO2_02_FULL_37_13b]OGK53002.1 MAG: hypothetical protein A3H78_02200 [Candidatus Roizmanbacteria bacterium RIFCSPLOWO2_02_FULL_36_11]
MKPDNLRDVATLHPISEDVKKQDNSNKITYSKAFLLLVLIFILGGLTGFSGSLLTKKSKSTINTKNVEESTNESNQPVEKTAGVSDKKNFKDSAEGILKEGGIDGEGFFHLERPGGPSQNVYLTSTTVDLSQYIDKKVKVKGETYSAEKAGWLMEVGFIEVE